MEVSANPFFLKVKGKFNFRKTERIITENLE